MQDKLFNIAPEKREVIFYLGAYKGNRIAIKLMKLLNEGKTFTVTSVEGTTETRIFEISVFSGDYFSNITNALKNDLIELMQNETPDNYLFDFATRRLGFINSFNVFSEAGFCFEVCHKIKEVRSSGGTLIPENKITL